MFMRYVMARYESIQRELTYRIYVSDALKQIAENTAKFGGGGYTKIRLAEILFPKPEDNRTHEEVVEHIRGKLRELR